MTKEWQKLARDGGNRTAVAVALLAGLGVIALRGFRWSSGAQAVLLLLAAFSFVGLRRLREIKDVDHRRHAVATGWWYIATTNLMAVAYAWFMFDGYGQDPVELGGGLGHGPAFFHNFGSAAKDWMLASGVVGGMLAVFRSSTTNSAALAALRQNHELREEILALRRKLGDASELTTLALDAALAADVHALLRFLQQMVITASDLPRRRTESTLSRSGFERARHGEFSSAGASPRIRSRTSRNPRSRKSSRGAVSSRTSRRAGKSSLSGRPRRTSTSGTRPIQTRPGPPKDSPRFSCSTQRGSHAAPCV